MNEKVIEDNMIFRKSILTRSYIEAWLRLEGSGGLGKAGERGQAVGRGAYRKFAVATMGATIVGFNGGGIGDNGAAMVDYDGGELRQ
ncbi:hypothetical protein TIFTF001_024303 [Ficus carica]|uniref:Uncharacterized protein n=1 Tax=Ficus carica TaxID=3494 RepID=A0AA88APQ6_FICCA|nr:hypothetical protein TIFTF001_024303 [Ficus carica]